MIELESRIRELIEELKIGRWNAAHSSVQRFSFAWTDFVMAWKGLWVTLRSSAYELKRSAKYLGQHAIVLALSWAAKAAAIGIEMLHERNVL